MSTATGFAYTPLDRNDDSIRLLQVSPTLSPNGNVVCSLQHVSVKSCGHYYALSYIWGEDYVDVQPVLVDGEPVKITKNLESFLQHARVSFSGTMLWIDALCVDQQSIEERNHQVLLMRKIYAGARKVIVWLGYGDIAISQLFCRLYRTDGSPFVAGGPQDYQELLEAVVVVVSFRYWSRLWIIQELLLGKSIQLVYGHDNLAWDDLWLGVEELVPNLPQTIKGSAAQKHREQRAILKSSKERALETSVS